MNCDKFHTLLLCTGRGEQCNTIKSTWLLGAYTYKPSEECYLQNNIACQMYALNEWVNY